MADAKWKEMWEIIQIPVFVVIAWRIFSIFADYYLGFNKNTIQVIDMIFFIGLFLYVGFVGTKNLKKDIPYCVRAGAFAGIILGIVSALITVIAVFSSADFRYKIQESFMNYGIAEALDPSMITWFVVIAIVIGPLYQGLIGAIVTFISGYLTNKFL